MKRWKTIPKNRKLALLAVGLLVLAMVGCVSKRSISSIATNNTDAMPENPLTGLDYVPPSIDGVSYGDYLDSIPDGSMYIGSSRGPIGIDASFVGGDTEIFQRDRFLAQNETYNYYSPYNIGTSYQGVTGQGEYTAHTAKIRLEYNGVEVWSGERYKLYELFTDSPKKGFLVSLGWISESEILFNVKSDGWGQSLEMWILDVSNMATRKLNLPENYVSVPYLSPNGKYVMFGIKTSPEGDADWVDEWFLYEIQTNKITPLPPGSYGAWYLPVDTYNKIEEALQASMGSGFLHPKVRKTKP